MASALDWHGLSRPKKVTIVAIAVIALLAAAAWIASIVLRPSYETPAELMAKAKVQAALTGGAKAYEARCAYCHDTGFAPSIAGRNMDAGALAGFVRNGPGNMPAFPPTAISEADIYAITKHVNGLPFMESKQ